MHSASFALATAETEGWKLGIAHALLLQKQAQLKAEACLIQSEDTLGHTPLATISTDGDGRGLSRSSCVVRRAPARLGGLCVRSGTPSAPGAPGAPGCSV